MAGHKVGQGFAVYAATKYAVRALSEGLRQEVKPYNIRTTVISPGAVATELPNTATDLNHMMKFQRLAEIHQQKGNSECSTDAVDGGAGDEGEQQG